MPWAAIWITSTCNACRGPWGTSRRKIEYQVGKIARKAATQIMARDEQAIRDAKSLNGLVFPDKHLQERFYSIVPFIAKFGPGLVDELLIPLSASSAPTISSSWCKPNIMYLNHG